MSDMSELTAFGTLALLMPDFYYLLLYVSQFMHIIIIDGMLTL